MRLLLNSQGCAQFKSQHQSYRLKRLHFFFVSFDGSSSPTLATLLKDSGWTYRWLQPSTAFNIILIASVVYALHEWQWPLHLVSSGNDLWTMQRLTRKEFSVGQGLRCYHDQRSPWKQLKSEGQAPSRPALSHGCTLSALRDFILAVQCCCNILQRLFFPQVFSFWIHFLLSLDNYLVVSSTDSFYGSPSQAHLMFSVQQVLNRLSLNLNLQQCTCLLCSATVRLHWHPITFNLSSSCSPVKGRVMSEARAHPNQIPSRKCNSSLCTANNCPYVCAQVLWRSLLYRQTDCSWVDKWQQL